MLGLGLVPANFGLGLGISILAVWSPWICPFMNVVCLLFFFYKGNCGNLQESQNLRKICRKKAAAKNSDHSHIRQSIHKSNLNETFRHSVQTFYST